MKQTDEEFVIECGFSGDAEAGKTAVDLMRRLAEYGKVKPDTLVATSRIIDTGLIHPSDSIDLIEFTFQMEDILGDKLDETDFKPMADAGAEEMEIRTWVRMVLDIQKRKLEHIGIGTPLAERPSHTTDRTDRVTSGSAAY